MNEEINNKLEELKKKKQELEDGKEIAKVESEIKNLKPKGKIDTVLFWVYRSTIGFFKGLSKMGQNYEESLKKKQQTKTKVPKADDLKWDMIP